MTMPPDFLTSLLRSRRRRRTYVAALAAAAAVAASLAAVAAATTGSTGTVVGHAGSPTTSALFTSGTCEHEAALITTALVTDWVEADVDGDGSADRVATAVDEEGTPECRAF